MSHFSTVFISKKHIAIFPVYIIILRFVRNAKSMLITICRAKIHRATVTEANLNYEGSITIDRTLIDAAGLYEYEKVHVLNINTGSRLETYVIEGAPDSGTICLNGAAARLGSAGDKVIIIAYCQLEPDHIRNFKPTIIRVNNNNKVIS